MMVIIITHLVLLGLCTTFLQPSPTRVVTNGQSDTVRLEYAAREVLQQHVIQEIGRLARGYLAAILAHPDLEICNHVLILLHYPS